jgi:hypothetical protein
MISNQALPLCFHGVCLCVLYKLLFAGLAFLVSQDFQHHFHGTNVGVRMHKVLCCLLQRQDLFGTQNIVRLLRVRMHKILCH